MAAIDYDRLKRMAREARDAKIEAAKVEYREALRALDIVQKMAAGNGLARPQDADARKRIGRGVLTELIQEALRSVPASFTTQDVINVIVKIRPGLVGVIQKPSVAGSLGRMAMAGDLDLSEPGRGRRHAVFTRQTVED